MSNHLNNLQIKVGIIGATGYAGAELLRLLIGHPNAIIVGISSVSYEGKKVSEIYPNLKNVCDDILVNEDIVIDKSDVVFASLPHGLSEPIAKRCFDEEKIFIDLGADFRLYDEADYEKWYKLNYHERELHEKAVYCIPELHRGQAKGARIIGNPGCYPTSVALGLAPILAAHMVDTKSIIIDSKSGVSGAGRGLSQTTHYPDCNEAFSPYKVAEHRHTPEIEQTLSKISGEDINVTFVPHLLPVNRGILSTIYVGLNDATANSIDEIIELYREFYKDEKFVRILEKGDIANIKNVKLSNYCDISIHKDDRTNRLIVVSAIDNMVKGAAGQAIQNMNMVCNIEEDAGLCFIAPSL